MSFLSYLSKKNPANPIESDVTSASTAARDAMMQYGRKIGRVGMKGMRFNTAEQESALPERPVDESGRPIMTRDLSVEGQARANARATNDPAVVAASQANGMRGFYQPKTERVRNPTTGDMEIVPAPYGLSKQGAAMTAPEYAASVGRGTATGIRRFRTDEASRLQDKQYGQGLEAAKSMEESRATAAMGLAAARMAGDSGIKIGSPGAGIIGPDGKLIATVPEKQGDVDKDVLGTIAELEKKKQEILNSMGDGEGLSERRGMFNWWGKTRQNEIDELDAQINALRGTPTKQPESASPIATPKTQADYDNLPSGTKYIDPDDGKTYVKP